MSSYLGRNTCCRGRGAAPHALLLQWLGVLGFTDSVHDCTHMPHMERQVGQNPGRRGRNTCSRYRWPLGLRRPLPRQSPRAASGVGMRSRQWMASRCLTERAGENARRAAVMARCWFAPMVPRVRTELVILRV